MHTHLHDAGDLTSGGVGLSFTVVDSRFTVVADTVLETFDEPDDAAALLPGPSFAGTFYSHS